MTFRIMQFTKNNRGSITPSFVIIVMLMMLVGSYFFCLMKVYENRLIVRDAVDAAVTSALAGGAETREKATLYYEEEICIRSHTERDEDTGETYRICDEWAWVTRQGNYMKYIVMKPGEAEAIARRYMDLNMNNNARKYRIKEFTVTVSYDKGRPIQVESIRHNTNAPSSWWFADFGDSNPPALSAVSTREVRFPRWAKVTVEATVELDIPLGSLLGQDTMEFTWKADAVKELKDVSN